MGFLHHFQAPLGGVGERLSVQQQTVAVDGAAPHPTPQLVQLGEPQALRVVDDHQARVGNINTHLDHCRSDQQLNLASLERGHYTGFFGRPQLAMHQPDVQVWQCLA